jgi:hypothetical protein
VKIEGSSWPLGHPRPHDLRHTALALRIAAGAHPKEVAVRAGHTSVSFTLDRYGHLFPWSEEVLNDSLDAPAQKGRTQDVEAERARSCANEPDSFAHVARTPQDTEEVIDDSHSREQDFSGGRCGLSGGSRTLFEPR